MGGMRRYHASVVLGGKIYAMGGIGRYGNVTLDTVEVYDFQADSWQRVASMPQGRASHAATAMGGKIYVTGGCQQEAVMASWSVLVMASLSSVCVYDPQANMWTQLASMSIARQDHASAAVGGKLYVFGGSSAAGAPLSTTEVYDPASNSWAQGTSLTSTRRSAVAVAL